MRWLASHIVLLLLLPGLVAAQDVAVQALVNETTVGLEETVSFTLEVQGASFSDITTPEPPETEGLVLQNPLASTQRNISFINGELTQSVAYQWSFRPVRIGTATLRALTVTVNGRTYTTEPVRVEVVAQAQRPAQRRGSRPFGNPYGTPDPADAPEASAIGEDELFIRAIPSTRRAYQNEQVTVEYQLFFRSYIQPRHSRLADSWDAEGFWREELDVEARPMPRPVTENGIRYYSIVLKRVAVFPTRAGRLRIDPLKIETEVFAPRAGRDDPFGRMLSLSSPYEAIERASPAITIEALPLPDGAPPSFQGAVGTFQMDARLDRSEVEVGEPIQLTIRLSGAGNVAVLAPPKLEAPGIFEVYDPDVETTLNASGRQVRGMKTFTYLLVPRTNGTFELPALRFAYFDPQAAAYRQLEAAPMTVRVTGTAAPAAAGTMASGLPVDDVAPLKLDADWRPTARRSLHRNPWAFTALALPLLLLLGLAGYRRHTARLEGDVAYARNRRATALARKHLKQAEALRREGAEAAAFYSALEQAVLGFVGDRLNLAERGLTRLQLDGRLAEAGAPPDVRAEVQALLESCDRGRFSPTRPTPAEADAALDTARRLLARLDAAFRQDEPAPAAS